MSITEFFYQVKQKKEHKNQKRSLCLINSVKESISVLICSHLIKFLIKGGNMQFVNL
jgi:hypothetical protein